MTRISHTCLLSALLLGAAMPVAYAQEVNSTASPDEVIRAETAAHPDVSVKVDTITPVDPARAAITPPVTTTTVTIPPHTYVPQGAPSISVIDPANYQPVTDPQSQLVYISGGIGEGEAAYFRALKDDYTFKELIADKEGHLLSSAIVTIEGAKGQINATLNNVGPFVLVKLPAGKYKIVTTVNGTDVARNVVIKSGKLTAVDVRF